MDAPLEIEIRDDGKLVFQEKLDTATELGRQEINEKAPYCKIEQAGMNRMVIARLDEVTIPRKLVRVERTAQDRVKLSNLSKAPLQLNVDAPLEPRSVRELPLPVMISIASKTLTLRTEGSGSDELQSLPDSSFAPGAADPAASLIIATQTRDQIAEGNIDNEKLLLWIKAAQVVLHSAAGTNQDFFRQAARAIVDLLDIDFACVLLPENGKWVVQNESRAGHPSSVHPESGPEWQPSRQVLDSVLREKKTFWQRPDAATSTHSLVGIKSVVASPILSARNEVIGVLYGERRRVRSGIKPINRLVAMLVEMLAGGVAAGLARLAQERTRFLWEQFVTPELSRQLADNPGLLEGRDAEVTMLSCDIRGFSRICNKLGTARSLEWVRDALGTLSDCALDEEGVLVDYVGDELLAMWGAPKNQHDHAPRACRAALAMLGKVPVLNGRWLETVKEPMGLNIGISSGNARVGNIGSERKFKYGALGTTVNLASRVQGATKFLKVPVLITEAVQERLDSNFRTRRLGEVRVVNLPDAVTLWELVAPDHPDWDTLKGSYEQALVHFEKREFRLAARVLGGLVTQPQHREDGPSLVLLQRAVTCLVEQPREFSPVWELPGKGK
jgi:adenylate cyclase